MPVTGLRLDVRLKKYLHPLWQQAKKKLLAYTVLYKVVDSTRYKV
jgi:hypothetical protein